MSNQARLLPSLLDRLLDDRPFQSAEPAVQRSCSLAEYKASIVRDLEVLVNTRQSLVAEQIEGFSQLGGSILEYGMPDFISRSVLDPHDRRLIQQQLERAISTGDRRFRRVRVQLLAQQNGHRMLTFRVDAVLRLQDISRQVSFDAVLQVNTQEYKVQNLN
ncbi:MULTISPECIES: type VI secretion system baseplate subunit TssE [Pseudomonas]|jgi:type VI secretion system protein ImpF|uniref:Type VI secretion system baseplate subunit TssE n=1 Tax=Pseudomonas putida TaxID=303 RepID=A0A7Y7ZAI9_PSEPU|nr:MULTISPECIES: type VI secretion system baseplate subunit TssE [Pseudomonas]QPN47849.1 type VI secretion system baseplate subunit TssE [Priestia aryabhattai]MBG6128333.1 type VI secretion system protein ImpF [Pseudomonas sp. M2]NSX19734.1 type VI secretion system baseplate subunit TssE [Pseudomonas putida]NWC80490.1 type VI secretion system baseplate subunit TssE [Pseudomonas putida]HDS1746222.1 type VI secretion system baseplate subunit TssE [Pseudomonas putida]